MKSENGENKIKQRLVGALVLIALAVIIIPLILDFRKDYGTVIKGTNIPPKPDDFRIEVVPIQPPQGATTPPVDGIISEMSGEDAGSSGTLSKDTSAPAPAPAPLAKPEARNIQTEKSPPSPVTAITKPDQAVADPAGQGWVVQLGSFSNKPNAEDLRDQLQKKGYKAFVDEIRVDNTQIQRVRIGPFDKKIQAEAIRDKVIVEMKLNAIVVSDR